MGRTASLITADPYCSFLYFVSLLFLVFQSCKELSSIFPLEYQLAFSSSYHNGGENKEQVCRVRILCKRVIIQGVGNVKEKDKS